LQLPFPVPKAPPSSLSWTFVLHIFADLPGIKNKQSRSKILSSTKYLSDLPERKQMENS